MCIAYQKALLNFIVYPKTQHNCGDIQFLIKTQYNILDEENLFYGENMTTYSLIFMENFMTKPLHSEFVPNLFMIKILTNASYFYLNYCSSYIEEISLDLDYPGACETIDLP